MKLNFIFVFFCLNAQASFGQDTIRTFYDEEESILKEIYFRVNGKAEGEVKLYDPEGKLIQIGFLKNNQKEGLFVDLSSKTGDTIRVTPYLADKRNGKVISYYSDGTVEQESIYQDNQIEGVVKTFYPSGALKDETQFASNKPNGESKGYFESGKLVSKKNFLNGNYEGAFENYDENGTLIFAANYSKGVLDGAETLYFPDGAIQSLKEFSEGELNGTYRLNFADGSPERTGNYKNGLPTGKFLEYHADGSLRSQITYKKGIPTSPLVNYHSNGEVSLKREFVSGSELLLRESTFYTSGQLIMEKNFRNGLANGEVKIFREDGSIQEIRNYKNDDLHGLRSYFNDSGILTRTETYVEGKPKF